MQFPRNVCQITHIPQSAKQLNRNQLITTYKIKTKTAKHIHYSGQKVASYIFTEYANLSTQFTFKFAIWLTSSNEQSRVGAEPLTLRTAGCRCRRIFVSCPGARFSKYNSCINIWSMCNISTVNTMAFFHKTCKNARPCQSASKTTPLFNRPYKQAHSIFFTFLKVSISSKRKTVTHN